MDALSYLHYIKSHMINDHKRSWSTFWLLVVRLCIHFSIHLHIIKLLGVSLVLTIPITSFTNVLSSVLMRCVDLRAVSVCLFVCVPTHTHALWAQEGKALALVTVSPLKLKTAGLVSNLFSSEQVLAPSLMCRVQQNTGCSVQVEVLLCILETCTRQTGAGQWKVASTGRQQVYCSLRLHNSLQMSFTLFKKKLASR